MNHSVEDLNTFVDLFKVDTMLYEEDIERMPAQWKPKGVTTVYDVTCVVDSNPMVVPIGCVVIPDSDTIERVSLVVNIEWFKYFDTNHATEMAGGATYSSLHFLLTSLSCLCQKSFLPKMGEEVREGAGLLHTFHAYDVLQKELSLALSRIKWGIDASAHAFAIACELIIDGERAPQKALIKEQDDLLRFFPLIRKASGVLLGWSSSQFTGHDQLQEISSTFNKFLNVRALLLEEHDVLRDIRQSTTPHTRDISKLIHSFTLDLYEKRMVGTNTLTWSTGTVAQTSLPNERVDNPTATVTIIAPTTVLSTQSNAMADRVNQKSKSTDVNQPTSIKDDKPKPLAFIMPQPAMMQ